MDTVAIQRLHAHGHEHTRTFAQRRHHFRLMNNLREMRRADFLFAFGDKNQVHGQLAPGVAERLERR